MNEHRAGPVRSAAAREAILTATAQMFRRVGYDQLTIEGIAKEAGVGKQTIYRWWSSRGALIAECLTEGRLFGVDLAAPRTGDLVADVEAWTSRVLSILESHNGESLLRSLVAAAAEDSDVGNHLSTSLGVDRQLTERLQLGVEEGQLPEDAPVDQLGQAIMGAIVLQVLARRSDYAEPVQRLVHFLLTDRTG
ncbi:transcriptional regulator, TetR family [Microbacterium sp. cf046]|uniref:TetR/AcrR family transcriptional regulator n=1 Tax=Microbacterium sp. cf046 TaxID=1761803 RepID=UPI0008EBE7D7|nr:TetR/AcrR family transcriptional regulator [Microbacterium sp. cf046]SFR92555.1 transcriptional regulator, TetR family [Microbacterium sp. cf046]